MILLKVIAESDIKISDEVKGNIPQIAAGDNQIIQLFNTAYLWAGIICVAIIIVSGILYTTSAGDSARVKTAKNAITYAVVGIVVILLAFTITNFVIGKVYNEKNNYIIVNNKLYCILARIIFRSFSGRCLQGL